MARGAPWSRAEVEATVAAYLDMLALELKGSAFNKAERRRALQELLHGRSEPAIERKHQNISAVLIELGFPYIDGYKPLGNFQELLRDVVEERLNGAASLVTLVEEAVKTPVEVPTIDDILAALVDPPPPRPRPSTRYPRERRVARPPTRINYLEREVRNAALGEAGERFVLRFEQARLIAAGHDVLAARVEQVSATRGDYEGFDILSFEPDGAERLVEVKTTGFGRYTPFFVTPNEVSVSRREAEAYHLYRLFSFREEPRLFTVAGALDRNFQLEASEFVARVG
jgi:hypothetical protein